MKISINESKIKVIFDHNKACANICQRNMDMGRIYETETVNDWKKDTKNNIWIYKWKRWHMEIKTNDKLNNLSVRI